MKNNIRMLAIMAMVTMLLTLVPAVSLAESQMIVTGDFVNFRASYAGGGTILACLRKGTIVTQLSSQTYNGGWYHVKYNNQSGYIWGEYVKAYKASSSNTSKQTANNKQTTYTGQQTTTTAKVSSPRTEIVGIRRNNDTVRATVTKQTNVRKTASASSKVLGTLKTRTTVSVLSRRNNYVYITTSKMSGYVTADSVMLNNTKAQTAKVKKVANGNYKVYSGSTGSGPIVGTAKTNSSITVLHQGKEWSYVKVGNVYGYISKQIYDINQSST